MPAQPPSRKPASYGGDGGYSTAAGIGPGMFDTKPNIGFPPNINNFLNYVNMQPVPLPQKGANSVGGYTSPGRTPTGLGADTSGPQGINSPLVGTPGNAGIEHLVGRCCPQMLVTGQKHCMRVGVRLTSYTLFSANTEDVPQTLRLQMTPTRSLSPRVRFWILLITTGNGGRYGEKTALLVVRRVAFTSLLLPRY